MHPRKHYQKDMDFYLIGNFDLTNKIQAWRQKLFKEHRHLHH